MKEHLSQNEENFLKIHKKEFFLLKKLKKSPPNEKGKMLLYKTI